MTETNIKYFTPEEANRTLPLVKQIVRDILNKGYEIKLIVDSNDNEVEITPELQSKLDKMDFYINELKELGCHYKDWNFSIGLVDFPSFIDDEEVYLCWKSDEEEITYYHNSNEGFAGRKKIPEELLVKETNVS